MNKGRSDRLRAELEDENDDDENENESRRGRLEKKPPSSWWFDNL